MWKCLHSYLHMTISMLGSSASHCVHNSYNDKSLDNQLDYNQLHSQYKHLIRYQQQVFPKYILSNHKDRESLCTTGRQELAIPSNWYSWRLNVISICWEKCGSSFSFISICWEKCGSAFVVISILLLLWWVHWLHNVWKIHTMIKVSITSWIITNYILSISM